MGFFKKLKERLFLLELDDKKEERKLNELESKINEKFRKQVVSKKNKSNKYLKGISKSSFSFAQRFKELKSRHAKIDESFFSELEEILIMADISWVLAIETVNEVKKQAKIGSVLNHDELYELVIQKLFDIYKKKKVGNEKLIVPKKGLAVYLIIGVNGSGKTTSVAKLAKSLKTEGKKVVIAAADTFRAGAVEQLSIWAERIDVKLIKSKIPNADPSSVVYDSLDFALNNDYDVLIIDTAGRLENKVNLMKQLNKMFNVIKNKVSNAPHETLLVLDATTGQNGIDQAKTFSDLVALTGIILTKMDGTSKGGIALSIKDALNMPVKYVGFGEGINDFASFNLDLYIYGLTKGISNEKH